jgi:hypothetical protein
MVATVLISFAIPKKAPLVLGLKCRRTEELHVWYSKSLTVQGRSRYYLPLANPIFGGSRL